MECNDTLKINKYKLHFIFHEQAPNNPYMYSNMHIYSQFQTKVEIF